MTQFVAIAPSEGDQKTAFKRFYDGGYAAMGWLSDTDLTGKSLSEVNAIIEQQIHEEQKINDKGEKITISAEKNQSIVKRNFLNFLSLKIGTLVVVPNINYGIHGVGRVTSGYKYQQNKHDSTGRGDDSYSHYVDVEWFSITPAELTRDALLLKDASGGWAEASWPTRGFACSSVREAEWLDRLLLKLEGPSTQVMVEDVTPLTDEEDEDEEEEPEEIAQDRPYTGDPFTINEDGHFVGDDGFVVPRDFNEFMILNPKYVQRWVQKRIGHPVVDADVEDWESDLLMHLRYLPAKSKSRLPGANKSRPNIVCEDVIQTFDPILQYGASARRFYSYMKKCLSRRFSTIMSKRIKNPVTLPNNLIMGNPSEDHSEVVDDEYVHNHVVSHVKPTVISQDVKIYLDQFRHFVLDSDPDGQVLLEWMDVFSTTGSHKEAMQDLGMTEQEFTRCRNRLRVLRECFVSGELVPKQRKPYKRREMVLQ